MRLVVIPLNDLCMIVMCGEFPYSQLIKHGGVRGDYPFVCVTPKARGDYPLAFMLVMKTITYDPYVVMWRQKPTFHIKIDM